jgi:hypothetical protein
MSDEQRTQGGKQKSRHIDYPQSDENDLVRDGIRSKIIAWTVRKGVRAKQRVGGTQIASLE